MKRLRLLEALIYSRREDGLSCRHGVKPPLTHAIPCAHCLCMDLLEQTLFKMHISGQKSSEVSSNAGASKDQRDQGEI